jgi:hypothetical protein
MIEKHTRSGGIAASVLFSIARVATQIAGVIKQPTPEPGQLRRVRYWAKRKTSTRGEHFRF